MEMIHVMIAFIIIMAMAAGTVALKLYLFPDETTQGFKPMKQQVMVIMMVYEVTTGNYDYNGDFFDSADELGLSVCTFKFTFKLCEGL